LNALPEPQSIYNGQLLEIPEITTEDVLKKLITLLPEKAPGPDNIYPIILKNLSNEIAKPLTKYLQKASKVE